MSDSIGYQSPAVYLPQASVLLQQPIRDRLENIEPAQKLEIDRAAELPEDRRVSDIHAGDQKFAGEDSSPEQELKDQAPPPGNKVMAQEMHSKIDDGEPLLDEIRKVSAQPGPAEVVGTKEALARLDQDKDGRIDQLEVKHAIRAESDSTTYSALSQYRKALELNEDGYDEQFDSKKLFDNVEGDKKLFDDAEVNKKLFNESEEDTKLFEEEELNKKLFDDEELESKLYDEDDEDALRRKIYGDPDAESGETADGKTTDENGDGVTEVIA